MLHARIDIAQILDVFQVRAVIMEFEAGTDPTVWTSDNHQQALPDGMENADALSITLEILRLWSERTIH